MDESRGRENTDTSRINVVNAAMDDKLMDEELAHNKLGADKPTDDKFTDDNPTDNEPMGDMGDHEMLDEHVQLDILRSDNLLCSLHLSISSIPLLGQDDYRRKGLDHTVNVYLI